MIYPPTSCCLLVSQFSAALLHTIFFGVAVLRIRHWVSWPVFALDPSSIVLITRSWHVQKRQRLKSQPHACISRSYLLRSALTTSRCRIRNLFLPVHDTGIEKHDITLLGTHRMRNEFPSPTRMIMLPRPGAYGPWKHTPSGGNEPDSPCRFVDRIVSITRRSFLEHRYRFS